MTPENQHIELMKFMGWKVCPCFGKWHDPNDEIKPLPPLTLDLMHSCEEKLTDNQWSTYMNHLNAHKSPFRNAVALCHAPIETRLPALLRTVGLWREE